MRDGDDIPGDDGCGDGGNLSGEISDAGERAHGIAWGDERGDGPGHRSGGGKAAQRKGNPKKSGERAGCISSTKDGEPATGAGNENRATNFDRITAALDQRIDEPPSDEEIGERG